MGKMDCSFGSISLFTCSDYLVPFQANPGSFTVNNYPCFENGENCVKTAHYKDPSKDLGALKLRLAGEKTKKGGVRG